MDSFWLCVDTWRTLTKSIPAASMPFLLSGTYIYYLCNVPSEPEQATLSARSEKTKSRQLWNRLRYGQKPSRCRRDLGALQKCSGNKPFRCCLSWNQHQIGFSPEHSPKKVHLRFSKAPRLQNMYQNWKLTNQANTQGIVKSFPSGYSSEHQICVIDWHFGPSAREERSIVNKCKTATASL